MHSYPSLPLAPHKHVHMRPRPPSSLSLLSHFCHSFNEMHLGQGRLAVLIEYRCSGRPPSCFHCRVTPLFTSSPSIFASPLTLTFACFTTLFMLLFCL